MQSSDELVTDMTAAPEQDAETRAMIEQYLSNLRMQQAMHSWANRPTHSRHHAARAQRAKARIAKRKSKR